MRDDQLPADPTNRLFVPNALTPARQRWGSDLTGSTVNPNGFVVWNVLVARGGVCTPALTTTAGGTAQLSVDLGQDGGNDLRLTGLLRPASPSP